MLRTNQFIQLLVFSLILATAGCTSTRISAEATAAFDSAMQSLQEGDLDKTEQLLVASVKIYPQDQKLAVFLAACVRGKWMISESIPLFAYAKAINPDAPEGQCCKLMLAIDAGNATAKDMEALERLQKENPDNLPILWLTANACLEISRQTGQRQPLEKSAEYYTSLLNQTEPGPAFLHTLLGRILAKLGRDNEALKHSQKAIAIHPSEWTYEEAGIICHMLKMYKESDEAFAKSIELAPDKLPYLKQWGMALASRKVYKNAEELFKEEAEITPADIDAQLKYAWTLKREKKFQEAMKIVSLMSQKENLDQNKKHAIEALRYSLSHEIDRLKWRALRNVKPDEFSALLVFEFECQNPIWGSSNIIEKTAFSKACKDIKEAEYPARGKIRENSKEVLVRSNDGNTLYEFQACFIEDKKEVHAVLLECEADRRKRKIRSSFTSKGLYEWLKEHPPAK